MKDDGRITVKEILERIDAQCAGMGQNNPNRVLLLQCRVAIAFLASQVPDESLVTRSPIWMP